MLEGFDTTVYWYHSRIKALMSRICIPLQQILPVNRRLVLSFTQSISVWSFIDSMLAGIQQAGYAETQGYWFNLWRERFKSYVDQEERCMDDVLTRLSYYIDAENTLPLVVGRFARPEQVMDCSLFPSLIAFTNNHFVVRIAHDFPVASSGPYRDCLLLSLRLA